MSQFTPTGEWTAARSSAILGIVHVRAGLLLAWLGACLVDIPDAPPTTSTGPGGAGSGGSVQSTGSAGNATASSSSSGGAPSSYSEEVLKDGPVGYWRLDDSAYPTAFDSSGNGLDGTFINMVELRVPGAIVTDSDNYAIRFLNGWIEVGNVLDFADHAVFTLEAWIHPNGDGGIAGKAVYDPAMGGYAGYIWAVTRGKLRLHRSAYGAGDSLVSPDDVDTTQFTYLVTIHDGVNNHHYFNGEETIAAVGNAVVPTIVDPLRIGSVQDWQNFDGVIDEVAIYDKVLAPDRILAHYHAAIGMP